MRVGRAENALAVIERGAGALSIRGYARTSLGPVLVLWETGDAAAVEANAMARLGSLVWTEEPWDCAVNLARRMGWLG